MVSYLPLTSRFSQAFDHVFVLNLPDRADRRRDMLVELRRAGFPEPGNHVTFFPAIRPTESAGFPSIGARGCYLSHLAMLKEAHRQKFSRILILEDDLCFSPLLLQHDRLLSEMVDARPWHFAYFGHILPPTTRPTATPFFEVTDCPIVTAHFYALANPVFEPLIEFLDAVLTREPGDPAGGPMYNDGANNLFRQKNPHYTTLVARPSLGLQRPSRSDIAPRWFDHYPLFRYGTSSLRRLKARLQLGPR